MLQVRTGCAGTLEADIEVTYLKYGNSDTHAVLPSRVEVAPILLSRSGTLAFRPRWLSAGLVGVLHLPVDTIGTRFGGIPSGIPIPALPEFTFAKAQAVLPAALSFALLGSIESLLSAVVADGMTGRRHRSNCELVAQGVANVASSFFGGICVTGTIARTATNVRAGAHGPVAGILHADRRPVRGLQGTRGRGSLQPCKAGKKVRDRRTSFARMAVGKRGSRLCHL